MMNDGVAMLAGIDAGLAGIQAAVDVGAAWSRPLSPPILSNLGRQRIGSSKLLDEFESKELLAKNGIPVPPARVVRNAEEAVAAAGALGYPVVVKTLGVAHKTEFGGCQTRPWQPGRGVGCDAGDVRPLRVLFGRENDRRRRG